MTTFKSSILQELAWRQLIHQTTHDELDKALADKPATLYCGFDPSGPSLHVGHLMAIMMLANFQRHGHNPLALVGGATGLIGDPSGKSVERNLLTSEALAENIVGIGNQLRAILDRALTLHPDTIDKSAHQRQATAPPIVNNADWINQWTFIDFLRDVGRHFRVNHMLAKDSVRSRLEERDQGISYTEFSYMLIQSYDFYHLQTEYGCTLQIGGSDQWGNITAGTDFIRRKSSTADAFGLTFPLITSSTGQKLGKTEKGAVWLDPERTSPYQFYQYWLTIDDADVIKFLGYFTFMSADDIKALQAELDTGENRGQIQQRLAAEVTTLVHGQNETDRAIRASKMLFGEKIEGLSDRELESIFADVPSTSVERARLEAGDLSLIDLLVETGLQKSKGQARRLLEQGGVYINNDRNDDPQAVVTLEHLASESMLVLRAGKKNYHVVRVN